MEKKSQKKPFDSNKSYLLWSFGWYNQKTQKRKHTPRFEEREKGKKHTQTARKESTLCDFLVRDEFVLRPLVHHEDLIPKKNRDRYTETEKQHTHTHIYIHMHCLYVYVCRCRCMSI